MIGISACRHLATQNGRVPAVQRLLQANADPFIEDCKGGLGTQW